MNSCPRMPACFITSAPVARYCCAQGAATAVCFARSAQSGVCLCNNVNAASRNQGRALVLQSRGNRSNSTRRGGGRVPSRPCHGQALARPAKALAPPPSVRILRVNHRNLHGGLPRTPRQRQGLRPDQAGVRQNTWPRQGSNSPQFNSRHRARLRRLEHQEWYFAAAPLILVDCSNRSERRKTF